MPKKILIVDDDEKIMRMVLRRLEREKYEVHTANNGKTGVEKALGLRPDLTLMDMHMPIMNGYDAVKHLRDQGYHGLIVAFTASVMTIDSRKAIKVGCNDFISKPIEPDFEKKIKSILDGSVIKQ